MMKRLATLVLALFVFQTGIAFAENPAIKDADRDGLDDYTEQELLVRFVPSLMIDSRECDGKPAEFLAGAEQPEVIAHNGTIYGQVFPIVKASSPTIEIHYYHLWSRDCGRLGHALDPEHVSVRVHADRMDAPVDEWRAQYWYAAAHEGTLCAASSGALAPTLHAEERGAAIWISKGKHGSFLSPDRCRLGCGGDSCENAGIPMAVGRIINIGEPNAPMNGALWADSSVWMLRTKMNSDFSDSVRARIDANDSIDGIVSLDTPTPPTKALLLGGNSTLGAVIVGNEWASRSIVIGTVPSAQGMEKAFQKTRQSLGIVGQRLRGLLEH